MKELPFRKVTSFGSSVVRIWEICRVVSGMAIVAGLLYGDINPADDPAKVDTMS